eukprot:TRINITY_DN2438_c0_g1_i2.p1 TRINITY_DN2438_c0_g1~~TRINITY_DN2438_c0_g1_i2.p1  ORF type:complete len:671 (+),score=145.76 TRINITY_DN2438_c0_g1_i2:97-2109(+)
MNPSQSTRGKRKREDEAVEVSNFDPQDELVWQYDAMQSSNSEWIDNMLEPLTRTDPIKIESMTTSEDMYNRGDLSDSSVDGASPYCSPPDSPRMIDSGENQFYPLSTTPKQQSMIQSVYPFTTQTLGYPNPSPIIYNTTMPVSTSPRSPLTPHSPHSPISISPRSHSPLRTPSSPRQTQVSFPESDPDMSMRPVTQTDIMLDEIGAVVNESNNTLSMVANDIRNTNLPMPFELATQLTQLLNEIKIRSEGAISKCFMIESQFLLNSRQLYWINYRRIELNRILIQLNLYTLEVQYCLSHSSYDVVFAELFIISQPFPCTVKQATTVDQIEVKLLKGSRTQISVLGPVTAEIVNDWAISSTKKSMPPIKYHEEHLSNADSVTFTKLQFNIGTMLKAIQVKFKLQVQIANSRTSDTQIIESGPSEHFIVITNTKQWAEATGILLKKELFRAGNEVHSQFFCNLIHMYYLHASKQDLLKAPRPLGVSEFNFFFTSKFHKQFQMNDIVSHKDYDSFWEWFGPVLAKIRFHKFLLQLWTSGLFWGFLSKQEAEQALGNFGAGAFVLRFSERMSGHMAVAYKQSQDIARHYLIKAKDAGQGRSLPQFIRETSSLLEFLKVTFVPETSQKKLSLLEKHQALQRIGNKRKKPDFKSDPDHYDEEIHELGIDNLSLDDH